MKIFMAVQYGKTWWGQKWLDALKNIDFTNRLPRGKTYANTGKVYDININGNTITGKVKGNYRKYYEVTLKLNSFTQSEKELVARVINNHPSILAGLLNKKLPEELYYKLAETGIELFPKSWEDISAECNCPDYALPCKHIASLIYMISIEIDKNPFKIFEIHNCDLLGIIDHLDNVEDLTVRKITSVSDILFYDKKIDKTRLKYDRKITEDIDFSDIPILSEYTLTILKSFPLFYDKDFKNVVESVYKSMARYCKKYYDYNHYNNEYNNDFIILKTGLKEISKLSKREDETLKEWKERYLSFKWNNPKLWEEFRLVIDDNYRISKISIKDENTIIPDKEKTNSKDNNPFVLENNKDLENILLGFLVEISHTNTLQYNYNIQFLHLLLQFSLKLIEKQGIIPEIIELKDSTYHIRWVPCLFDKKIDAICEKLYSMCPDNLICYKNSQINRKQQVITGISLIISGIMEHYTRLGMPKMLERQSHNPIFRLFFFNERLKFDEFKTKGYEFLIDQWLSNLYLRKRDYNLYLIVEETVIDESFSIHLKVGDENTPPEAVYEFISGKKDYIENNRKLQLLSDLYLIQEYFPEIRETVDLKKPIILDMNEFSGFFMDILPLLEVMGISVILPKSLEKIVKPKLVLDLKSTKELSLERKTYLSLEELVKFDWKIAIGENDISKEEFKMLLEKSEKIVKIRDNYVILDKKEIKSFIKRLDKLPETLSQTDLIQAIISGEFEESEVNIDYDIKSLFERIKKYENIEVPGNLNAELRPYQEIGFSWLLQNINLGFGSVLADDMGLGKTLQVLSSILHLKNKGCLDEKKVLVIAPTGLLFNWQNEMKKFTPTLKPFIYHGTNRKFPKKDDFDVVISSYGTIRRDVKKFKRIKWYLLVVDEAQNIKNPTTKQTKAIKAIKSDNKIALTGTPVENRLADYWSIFDLTNKHYLGSIRKFTEKFIIPIEKERNEKVLKTFRKITDPFILRRLKTDKEIIKDLPLKIVNDVYCKLSIEQTALYKEMVDSLLEEIDESEGIDRKGLIFKLINGLKQICNHPAQFSRTKSINIHDSGKMEVLMNILENITENGENVLIFTQYVQMGNIMKKLVDEKFNTESLFLHGSLTRGKRDKMINDFQERSQHKIFIISLKAGGTGLNLTAAQNVIHYDLWWNPAVENQATDRAYRIGQKENVMVYRLITTGTFEEKINKMIESKKELADITVGAGENFITEMNNDELKEILKLRK
ncbi:MAG: DEAD/DEAH box helicase [Methanobacterium sp.]